jgi:hypothetical protein
MRRWGRFLPLVAVIACGLAVPGCRAGSQPDRATPAPVGASVLAARVVPSPATLPCYDVAELSLELDTNYAQPFFDVSMQAVFVEKPQLAAMDINAPHWYEREGDLQSDLRVWRNSRLPGSQQASR